MGQADATQDAQKVQTFHPPNHGRQDAPLRGQGRKEWLQCSTKLARLFCS